MALRVAKELGKVTSYLVHILLGIYLPITIEKKRDRESMANSHKKDMAP